MTDAAAPQLIGLDWGTSSLRAFLMRDGQAVETRHADDGIQRLAGGGAAAFERAFVAITGEWLGRWPALPVVACGMVGSAQGWREVPYVATPADAPAIVDHATTLTTAAGTRVLIAPGVLHQPAHGAPDVMRGEETQVIGALQRDAAWSRAACLVMPGTHSKWVQVRDGRIAALATYMSGELFAVLRAHSILGRLMPADAAPADDATPSPGFLRGVAQRRRQQGRAAAHAVFGAHAGADAAAAEGTDRRLPVGPADRQRADRRARAVAAGGAAGAGGRAGAVPPLRPCARCAAAPCPAPRSATPPRTGCGHWRARPAWLTLDPVSTADTPLPSRFDAAMSQLPLVAILRGLRPAAALDIGRALYGAGFRLIEVPLNSPEPLKSIAALRSDLPADALVGAGTVLTAQAVADVHAAGGELIVMPHADAQVIRAAKAAGLLCVPGVATPTEAFAALAAGADALKLFPAELVTPAVLKAMRAVLPAGVRLLPVGGITPGRMRPYLDVGAAGFGLGSALFTPSLDAAAVRANAQAFAAAWRVLTGAGG